MVRACDDDAAPQGGLLLLLYATLLLGAEQPISSMYIYHKSSIMYKSPEDTPGRPHCTAAQQSEAFLLVWSVFNFDAPAAMSCG